MVSIKSLMSVQVTNYLKTNKLKTENKKPLGYQNFGGFRTNLWFEPKGVSL